jgi:hypothetical protein
MGILRVPEVVPLLGLRAVDMPYDKSRASPGPVLDSGSPGLDLVGSPVGLVLPPG